MRTRGGRLLTFSSLLASATLSPVGLCVLSRRKDATMTASPAALRLEILDGNIALVTIDQPGSRANTLGQAVLGELRSDARPAQDNGTDLRGLILRSGKPGMFIAGADLSELGARRRHRRAETPRRQPRARPHRRLRGTAVSDRRRHRRGLHGRRAGTGAGLRLPPGQHAPEDGDRLAGDEDRPHPRLGRHAAVDAPHRPGAGRRDDLRRRVGQAERARQLGIVFDAVPPRAPAGRGGAPARMGSARPDDWQGAASASSSRSD